MQEVDINTLIDINYNLNKIISNDIIIVGKINVINIKYKYDRLDLSKVICNRLDYYDQEGESIKNHILPSSLKELYCLCGNQLTSLPNLPNLLTYLNCRNNQSTSFFTNFQLPNSLEYLHCGNNELTSLPQLPNSLEVLDCKNNKLTSLPEFKNKIELYFYQDKAIEYIPYTKNIILCVFYKNKINIKDYPYNPITNQDELDKYMKYQLQFFQNRKKSAKK